MGFIVDSSLSLSVILSAAERSRRISGARGVLANFIVQIFSHHSTSEILRLRCAPLRMTEREVFAQNDGEGVFAQNVGERGVVR